MLSLRLKRSVRTFVEATLTVTLVVTLAAVMLALFPAVAEAQAGTQAEDKSTSSVVVQPGDSLWSISEKQLGPEATPQHIVEGAAQIYALNRERIGADPNLILVGQKLLVPPAISKQPAGATPTHKKPAEATEAAGAAEAGPRDQATKQATRITADKAPGTAVGGAEAKGGEARKPAAAPVAEPVTLPALPDVAVVAPVPAVASKASNDAQPWPSVASFLRTIRTEVASAASALAESFFGASAGNRAEERQLLGLGVLVLTLVVAALVAWKLPMRRTTRRDAERWGTSSRYYGYYGEYGETPAASPPIPFVYHPGSLGDLDKGDERREATGALGRGPRVLLTGSEHPLVASTGRKAATAGTSRRAPKARAKARAVPRNGLALGTHNPEVRRAPRRVHATMRARKLRPRLRPRRGPSRRPQFPIWGEHP